MLDFVICLVILVNGMYHWPSKEVLFYFFSFLSLKLFLKWIHQYFRTIYDFLKTSISSSFGRQLSQSWLSGLGTLCANEHYSDPLFETLVSIFAEICKGNCTSLSVQLISNTLKHVFSKIFHK